MSELRCGNCRNWLGESVVRLVYVEHVPKGHDSVSDLRIEPPRDLRLCKSCERVSVFIPLGDLDRRRTEAVG